MCTVSYFPIFGEFWCNKRILSRNLHMNVLQLCCNNARYSYSVFTRNFWPQGHNYFVRFEFLTAVLLRSCIFWDVTLLLDEWFVTSFFRISRTTHPATQYPIPKDLKILVCSFIFMNVCFHIRCRNTEDRDQWRWSESPEPPTHKVNGDSKRNRSHSSAHRNHERNHSEQRRSRKDQKRSRSSSHSSVTSNSHRKAKRRKLPHSHSRSK